MDLFQVARRTSRKRSLKERKRRGVKKYLFPIYEPMLIQRQGNRVSMYIFVPAIPDEKEASASQQNLKVVRKSPVVSRSLSHLVVFSFTSVIHESPNGMQKRLFRRDGKNVDFSLRMYQTPDLKLKSRIIYTQKQRGNKAPYEMKSTKFHLPSINAGQPERYLVEFKCFRSLSFCPPLNLFSKHSVR